MYSSGGIEICLFDGKYRATVSRYETALGFVMGVQTVLNHVTGFTEKKKPQADAA